VTHLLALAGVLCISFSAVFYRLAAVSPVTATFFRALYAIPPLVLLWGLQRAIDRRSRRDRLFALASGLILAIDLNVWHAAIGMLGAGLGTVIPNVQVVFVALAAWALYGERPDASRAGTIVLVIAGLVMASGLSRPDAYGTNPRLGVVVGVAAGVCYAAYILVFHRATVPGLAGSSTREGRAMPPPAGPLLDSTVGVLAGAALSIPFDRHFTFTPPPVAYGWLVMLALVCQVLGWMLLATAVPRLPAIETSIVLLGQPVFAVIWGRTLFNERLSAVQWIGAAVVLAGVALMSMTSRHSYDTKSTLQNVARGFQPRVAALKGPPYS